MHDGCLSFDKYPTHEDFQILEEFADDEDEDEEDEFDEENSDREEAKEELEDLMDNGSDDEAEDVYGGDRIVGEKIDGEEGADLIGADEDVDELRVGQKRVREEPVIDRR